MNPLPRRHFLKHAGIAIGLPFLDSMLPSIGHGAEPIAPPFLHDHAGRAWPVVPLSTGNPHASIRVATTDASGAVSQGGFGVNASAGQTLNYQYWFRDTGNSCGGGFNFTNGWNQAWN